MVFLTHPIEITLGSLRNYFFSFTISQREMDTVEWQGKAHDLRKQRR